MNGTSSSELSNVYFLGRLGRFGRLMESKRYDHYAQFILVAMLICSGKMMQGFIKFCFAKIGPPRHVHFHLPEIENTFLYLYS